MDTNAASTPFRILLEETGTVYSPPLPMSVRLGVPALAGLSDLRGCGPLEARASPRRIASLLATSGPKGLFQRLRFHCRCV